MKYRYLNEMLLVCVYVQVYCENELLCTFSQITMKRMLGKTKDLTDLRLEVKERESLSKKLRNLVPMLDRPRKVKTKNVYCWLELKIYFHLIKISCCMQVIDVLP